MVRSMVPWTSRFPSAISPFEREMEDWMDDIRERFVRPLEGWAFPTAGFAPHIDVAETEGEFEILVELPGMKAEDFDLELCEGHLTISGKREETAEEKGKTYHRRELRYGEFRRVVPLGVTVQESAITAEYKNGVLHILVPKAEEVKPRHIEVKT